MEWVKTTAKTLPEAIDLALDNLGVDESEAEIVVLEEPRQGLFGRMRGTARVEARVKPKAIRPKTERNRNRRNRSEGGKGKGDRGKNRSRNRSGGQSGNRNSGNRESKSGNNRGGQGDERQRNDDRSRQGGRGQQSKDRSEDQGNRSSGSGGNRGRDGGGGRGGSGSGRERAERDGGQRRSKGRSDNKDNETKPKEETPVEEVAAHLQTFLSGLTEAFGFDSDVSVDSSEEDVLVGRIEGQHGLLVGPKGRTLDAVQELARISCQRTVPSSIRIKVDVGGYRQQRVEALTTFARKAADSAVADSAEVALEPMSAADRKAIHDALSEDGRVETRSVGTEPRRKVLVVPLAEPEADADAEEEDQVETGAADSDSDGSSADGSGSDSEDSG
ncbi:MAG: RNA-binding cell elongation regulator Jag/EloR, partial [Acidimicrobiales bacterium]